MTSRCSVAERSAPLRVATQCDAVRRTAPCDLRCYAEGMKSFETHAADLGGRARAAAASMRLAPSAAKNAALERVASALLAGADDIVEANRQDVSAAQAAGLSAAMLDRLSLDE